MSRTHHTRGPGKRAQRSSQSLKWLLRYETKAQAQRLAQGLRQGDAVAREIEDARAAQEMADWALYEYRCNESDLGYWRQPPEPWPDSRPGPMRAPLWQAFHVRAREPKF